MRSYPIDANRVRLISTGNCGPVPAWVVLSDGSRRPDPNGRQEVGEDGRPQWKVEVIAPADEGDDRDRTAVAEIIVSCKDQPDAGAFGDLLTFEGLCMQPGYLKKGTTQVTPPRWTADGIKRTSSYEGKAGSQHKAEQQAA